MRTLSALAYSILLLLSSCDGENDAAGSEQENISKKLRAAVWTPAEVKRAGVDITGEYTSMRLTIGANTYSTTHGGLSWPASGTWYFAEASTTEIIRDEAVTVTISLSSDAKTLTMDFDIPEREYTPGRVVSLEGQYHFRFTRP